MEQTRTMMSEREAERLGVVRRVLSKELTQAQAAVSAGTTRFAMVRLGHVLGSSGSVATKFRQQIRDGGPIAILHPDLTRCLMNIPDAAPGAGLHFERQGCWGSCLAN